MTRNALAAPDESRIEVVRRSALRVDEAFKSKLPAARNLEGIRCSIAELGILVPLITTQDLFVLDGHTRLEIAEGLKLERVPILRLPITRESTWAKTYAIAIGLDRRQLPTGQRVLLVTSLLKQEREAARERQAGARWGGSMRSGSDSDRLYQIGTDDPPGQTRATHLMAERAGVSPNTFIQALYVLEHAPAHIREGFILDRLKCSRAFKETKRLELKASAAAEQAAERGPGIYRAFEEIPSGAYRTIYMDPPWPYEDETCEGAAAEHYPSMSLEDLAKLDVQRLAHPDGCHLWLWTTWPKLRDHAPDPLLDAWGFRRVGEVCWVKDRLGAGRWLRSMVEICILAVRGRLPLLRDDVGNALFARRRKHSEKPQEMRALVESCSPGPRVELFARAVPEGWDAFGNEARRVAM